MLAIRSSITSCASDWFGLNVSHCQTLAEANGDIIVGLFSKLDLAEYQPRPQPLIVFEDFRTGLRPVDDADGLFYLSQPFGPHKFGRILGLCLEYRSAFPDTEKEVDQATSPNVDIILPDINTPGTHEKENGNMFSASLKSPQHVSSPRPGLSRSSSYFAPSRMDRGANRQAFVSGTPAPQSPAVISVREPRSVVLLVEDNAINMKVSLVIVRIHGVPLILDSDLSEPDEESKSSTSLSDQWSRSSTCISS